MRVFSIDVAHSVVRVMIAVACLLTGCGIGRCDDEVTDNDCEARIDSLLELHDLCKAGYRRPDSIAFYTVEALKLAKSCYGFDSEEYISIFTDYMMMDCRKNRELICESVYPIVAQEFNPFTEWVWYPYYNLGLIMESLGEYDKAKDMFERIEHTKTYDDVRLEALIRLTNLRQRKEGGNLEYMLHPVTEEVVKLQSPEKEDLLCLVVRLIAEYYFANGNDKKAIEFIEYGERLEGHVSSHKIMMLLRLKFKILVRHDHIAAVECLDKTVNLIPGDDLSSADRDWLGVALVSAGDYAMDHLLNADMAYYYYNRAFNLYDASKDIYNPAMQEITRRMITLLKLYMNYDAAVKLGECLVKASCFDGISDVDALYVIDLMDSYISVGKTDEASGLLSKYRQDLLSYPEAVDRVLLQEGHLRLAEGKYEEAARILEGLLVESDRKKTNKDIRMRAERYLASAYYKQGDSRVKDMSRIINRTTKRIVAEQLWFITPRQRVNWLGFCEEALKWQLSMDGNAAAVMNAADLNLFKKSLLFRTVSQVEKILEADPEASESMAELKSLRKEMQTASNRGDSVAYSQLRNQADDCEQRMVNRFLKADRLLRRVNVRLGDVVSRIDSASVAVDFISLKDNKAFKIGAFVYSREMRPCYVPLLEYTDSIGPDAAGIIWKKLSPVISRYKEIYFCADGILNDIAIEYAEWHDGRRVNDVFRLHRVFHLADIKTEEGIGDKIVFVGVADHNSPVEGDSRTIRGNWTDLQNVGMELEMIRNSVDSGSLKAMVDNQANERSFKALDGSDVSTLHISTHGVFRNRESLRVSLHQPDSEDHHMAKRLNALGKTSISALVLRQGNVNWHSPGNSDGEDDLLTAEEIETMSFPDLQLTVLSACDTGLGEVDSEGVWGLQRAFRIAGTKSLICSLTKVDDYWTAQFMDIFYEHAAKGNTIYDSFHKAQRWLYNELPDNPEVWSSFILIE